MDIKVWQVSGNVWAVQFPWHKTGIKLCDSQKEAHDLVAQEMEEYVATYAEMLSKTLPTFSDEGKVDSDWYGTVSYETAMETGMWPELQDYHESQMQKAMQAGRMDHFLHYLAWASVSKQMAQA